MYFVSACVICSLSWFVVLLSWVATALISSVDASLVGGNVFGVSSSPVLFLVGYVLFVFLLLVVSLVFLFLPLVFYTPVSDILLGVSDLFGCG